MPTQIYLQLNQWRNTYLTGEAGLPVNNHSVVSPPRKKSVMKKVLKHLFVLLLVVNSISLGFRDSA